MFIRLFDIKLNNNLDNKLINDTILSCIKNKNKLLMSIDTIFIGSKYVIDYLFSFGENMDLYHDTIWSNKDWSIYFKNIDSCLYRVKPTYCSEVQIYSHIFFSNLDYENIRVDFNNIDNQLNNKALFHVKLCNQRKNSIYNSLTKT